MVETMERETNEELALNKSHSGEQEEKKNDGRTNKNELWSR